MLTLAPERSIAALTMLPTSPGVMAFGSGTIS
jgi:hypothetical protein